MALDILSALNAAPSPGERRCKVRRVLDDLANEDGADALIAAVNDPGWNAQRLAIVFGNIGTPISNGIIQDHRGKRCICFQG